VLALAPSNVAAGSPAPMDFKNCRLALFPVDFMTGSWEVRM
jgi:hypothetical protein